MNRFSLIIPTLNEEKNIGNLLSDIKNQSLKPFEIIVVDGNSSDKTLQIAKKYKEVTIIKTSPSVSAQRNIGAETARGDILYFLDADTRIPKNFFQKTIIHFSKNENKIACPYYLPYKSTPLIFSIYLFFNFMFFIFQKISPSGAGSSIIMNKKLFTQLKGFNTQIKFEDIELIRRAAKKNSFFMLPTFIWVSDRRFKEYGVIRTTIQYLLLSLLFLLNQFNYTPFIPYQLGNYQKSNQPRNLNKKRVV